jgi:shikimate kinase
MRALERLRLRAVWRRQPIISKRFILLGPSGSGKSALSSMVAREVGIQHFDTDLMILERVEELTIAQVFDAYGEAEFRRLERECIDEISAYEDACVVATGGGLPAIPGMADTLNQLGMTIYLRASVDTLWLRLNMDPESLAHRPLLRVGGKQALEDLVLRRMPVYEASAITFDTDRLTAEEVGSFLISVVEQYRVE